MAHAKSAKKRIKTNEIRRQRNVARRSEIKTLTKKVLAAVSDGDTALAKDLLKKTEAKIARARGKGLYKKNTAARKVSRLAKRVSAPEKAAVAS